jgi:hypothetical protein
MKRFVLVAVVAVLVALAVPALAATQRRTYFGPAAGGVNNAGVEISAKLASGTPSKLTKFEWHNVPGRCGVRSSATTDQFPSTVTVKDGKFHETDKFNSGRAKVTVSGEFKHQNQKMKGTLRVRGTVAGCASLDTGTVSWTAKQPAGQK